MKPLLKTAPVVLALAGVYFAAGKAGLQMALYHESASPVWPPTGISLAALLLLGFRVWPGLFLGAFLVNVTTKGTLATSIGIGIGNTLEAVVGAWLVARFAGGRRAFERAGDVVRFAVLAGLASSLLSATFGVGSLALGGFLEGKPFFDIWFTWWVGDAVSDFVFAPLLLAWTTVGRLKWSAARLVEAVLLLAAIVGTGEIMFGGWQTPLHGEYPLAFLVLPVVVWASYRFHQYGSAIAVFLLSLVAVGGTLGGAGPFTQFAPNTALLLLQAFTGTVAVTGMMLAALVSERRKIEDDLRLLNESLERRVQERTAQLQDIKKELEGFAYSVAHDLRAPLRGMAGFSNALLEDYRDRLDPTGQDYARRIAAACQHMDLLIQDLLTYSRLSREDVAMEAVDLGDLVQEAMAQVPEARSGTAEIAVERPLGRVRGQRTVLLQVVVNLLSNAVKFVEPGVRPRIRVHAERRDGALRLWVEDNGIGIAPEHVERLFRVFERLNPIERYPGTGLGLAIVRRALDRLGGRVGVESEPGRGSRFWIELAAVND